MQPHKMTLIQEGSTQLGYLTQTMLRNETFQTALQRTETDCSSIYHKDGQGILWQMALFVFK